MAFWDMTMSITMSNGDPVVTTIDLGDFSSYDTGLFSSETAAVESAANQIKDAYQLLTYGEVSNVEIKKTIFTSNGIPTDDAQSWDKLKLSVYLADVAGEKANRKAPIYVVAPRNDIFLDDQGDGYDIVNTSNANLIDYVQQRGQHSRVSKNETIDLAKNNGIHSGKRIGQNRRRRS